RSNQVSLPGRTTSTLVRGIVDADLDVSLDPFIDAANELVTEICSFVEDVDGNLRYTSSRLELIERWLAAHFYCILDARGRRERVSSLTFESQSKVDLGLDVTHYGQQAKRLDTAGGLAKLDDKTKTTAGKTLTTL